MNRTSRGCFAAVLLIAAAAEYYYPRDEAKVSAMMDTLRWK